MNHRVENINCIFCDKIIIAYINLSSGAITGSICDCKNSVNNPTFVNKEKAGIPADLNFNCPTLGQIQVIAKDDKFIFSIEKNICYTTESREDAIDVMYKTLDKHFNANGNGFKIPAIIPNVLHPKIKEKIKLYNKIMS